METSKSILKSAVFFDAENVSARNVPAILSFLRGRGDVPVIRAYADFSKSTASSWNELLRQTPITAVQVCHKANPISFYTSSGEAVDKAIFMDAPIIALTHSGLNEIVIVSSDGGYHFLATKLRELGKNVLGIGERAKSSTIWTKACNEFCYIEDLPSGKLKESLYDTRCNFANILDDWQEWSKWHENDSKEAEQEEADVPDAKDMASTQDGVYMEGTVDNYLSNCGFIKTSLGEEYYFSPRSITGGCVSRGAKVRFIASRKPNSLGKTINERRGKAYNVSVMA